MIPFLTILLTVASVAETITGDWVPGRRHDFRYVTEYEVQTIRRPFAGVPWIEEDCHDDGDRFANWSRTISYAITYSGGLSFELLGVGLDLGAERTRSVELAFERWIHATAGVRARHVLHEQFENWTGETRVEFLRDGVVVPGKKTYPFRLTHLNYGLSVERQILELCDQRNL